MNLPIRVRLTAWYAALLATTIVALSTFLVLQLRADLRQSLDEEARIGSIELARAITEDARDDENENESDEAQDAEDERDFQNSARAILSASGAGAQLIDDRFQVLVSYGVAGNEPMVSPRVHAAAVTGPPRTYTASFGEDGQEFRVRVSSFRVRDQVRVLVLTESLQPVEAAVNRVLSLLMIAGPAAIALTGLIAYWLAHKALQPVERITSDAQDIGIDQLNERVAVPDSHDETRRLAVTLNAMLERIEQGVLERHRLVANASHKPRTPLAVMRSEIDVTLGADELSPAAREVLSSVREEVDRMARTIENLLTLAQADEGRLELLTVPVDLRQVAEDAARALQPLAAAKGQSLEVEGRHEEVQADPPRLVLVMTNLIENAIKFSPDGGAIRVASWRHEEEVGVSVTDDGPGIPVPDRENLFDRFYRVDSARGRAVDGNGLGLAICREVAVAHGGRIWVVGAPGGGSVFSVALPGWRSLQRHDVHRSAPLAGGE